MSLSIFAADTYELLLAQPLSPLFFFLQLRGLSCCSQEHLQSCVSYVMQVLSFFLRKKKVFLIYKKDQDSFQIVIGQPHFLDSKVSKNDIQSLLSIHHRQGKTKWGVDR